MSDNGRNTIQILENGPVYFSGDIKVLDAEGNVVLEKSKVALCRCGRSSGKPACDGTHRKIGFEAAANADVSRVPAIEENNNTGTLTLKTMKNGPILVQGPYTLTSDETGEHTSDKSIALCRCGESSNKPFCDGTHKNISFEAS